MAHRLNASPVRREWRACACGCGVRFLTPASGARERRFAGRQCAQREGASRRTSPLRPPKPAASRSVAL